MSGIVPLVSSYETDTDNERNIIIIDNDVTIDFNKIQYPITTENKNCLSLDTFENEINGYNPLLFWPLWRDLPGRYEPFFSVRDIHEYGQCAWGLGSADFNEDGLLDFAVIWREGGGFEGGISLFINEGRNRFSESLISTIEDLHLDPDDRTASVPICDLDAADYDNDMDIDLLFIYSYFNETDDQIILIGSGIILFNDGNNQFNHWEVVFQHYPIDESNHRAPPIVSSADYDDDGDIDFLVGDNSGLVSFYKNDGTGVFDLVDTYDFGGRLSKGITSADFDNDGDIDFIVTQQLENKIDGCIYLVGNDGSQDCFNQSNRFKIADLPPTPSFFAVPVYNAGCLQSIDYNNDGKMDFLFSGSDTIFLIMQQENGVFDYFSICRLPAIFDRPFQWFVDHLRSGAMTVGDYNGDGLDDIMVGGVQGFVRLFTNQYVLVDIIKPYQSCVFVNDEIKFYSGSVPLYSFLKHGTSIVIGDITIVTKELQPLSKVEFYLGKKLVFTDEEPPFEWEWNRFSFGRHKVKAVAYDLDGNEAGFDDTIIWKFL